MGGFFLVHRDDVAQDDSLVARLHAPYARRGFAPPTHLQAGAFALYRYDKLFAKSDHVVRCAANGLCVAAGTFYYRGGADAAALRSLADDYHDNALDWTRLHGNFCILLVKDDTIDLLCDRLGSYRVYHNRARTIYATSLSALVEATPRLTADDQGVFEYLFLGSPMGRKTIFREVLRTPTNSIVQLDGRRAIEQSLPPLSVRTEDKDFAELLDEHLHLLRTWFATLGNVHGDRICAALTGGYDSRLMLALLRDQGLRPRVYVYGRLEDPDVRIASEIARGEGFALEHIDRTGPTDTSSVGLRAIVGCNFDSLDVMPLPGVIDNGSDVASRELRVSNGELMLNGTGGEAYRRPHLGDRPHQIREVVWRFFCGFDPEVLTPRFEEETYCKNIEQDLRVELVIENSTLTSGEADHAYPRFFGRSLAGHNTSVNNAFSWALTPFLDNLQNFQAATRLSFEQRRAGAFQAALIRRLDRSLASYPSAYGQPFDVPPDDARRTSEQRWSERSPQTFRHQPQPPRRIDWPPELDQEHLGKLFDPAFPYLRRFIDPDRVTDQNLFRRICTLEYAFQRGPARISLA